jgi:glutaconate CoA-transferase subunit B
LTTVSTAKRTDASAGYEPDDMMIVEAARALRGRHVCFVGIGLPSTAANLARATHTPDLVLVYESGTIGAKPTRLPLSIGDGELADTADSVVTVPEIFNYWVQAGRIEVGFLSAAQMDRHANLNSTAIGDYDHPSVRLPGAGGAPEIAASCREVIILIRQSHRTFVEHLDFRTSVGYGDGPGDRARWGLTGAGPTLVITDLGLLHPDPVTRELTMTDLHPGVDIDRVRAATPWDLAIAPDLKFTEPPSAAELTQLRALQATQSG